MTTKLQIPMDEKLKKGLEARAKKLGFDSAQAYIRFWATAEVDGRVVDFDKKNDSWGEPSPAAAVRLNQASKDAQNDHKTGKLKKWQSVDEALNHLDTL